MELIPLLVQDNSFPLKTIGCSWEAHFQSSAGWLNFSPVYRPRFWLHSATDLMQYNLTERIFLDAVLCEGV